MENKIIDLKNNNKIESLKELLLNDKQLSLDICNEINSWNGELDQFDVCSNDEEFFNVYFNDNPAEAVRAAFYGDYKYMDEYVRFDGYGNIESLDQYQLENEVEIYINDIIDAMIRNYSHINIYNDELIELIESIIANDN